MLCQDTFDDHVILCHVTLCYVTICHDMLLDMINLSPWILTCDFDMLYDFFE